MEGAVALAALGMVLGETITERYLVPVIERWGLNPLWKVLGAWAVAAVFVLLLNANFVTPLMENAGVGWGQPYDSWTGLVASILCIGVGSNLFHEVFDPVRAILKAAKPEA